MRSDIRFIYIGSCGSGWPHNSTPVQRIRYLARWGNVLAVDRADASADSLRTVVDYTQVPDLTYTGIAGALGPKFKEPRVNVFWSSPCPESAKGAIKLARDYGGLSVIDLFDHPALPAGVARAKNEWARFAWHSWRASQLSHAISKADLLVRAIASRPYTHLGNTGQVHCINGVCSELYESGGDWDAHAWGGKHLKCCYVGVFTRERSGVLAKALVEAAKTGVPLNFISIGPFDSKYAAKAVEQVNAAGTSVILRFAGLTAWEGTLRAIKQSDVCLYPFPKRPELDCVYPIKLGEYLALGKPVLTSDLQGAREMLGDGTAAFFIPANAPLKWVEGFELMYAKPELCREMAANARVQAKQLLWDNCHASLAAHLPRLVGSTN